MENNELLELAARLTPEWLAGFFDGEGCVCIQKQNHIRVNITQANAKLLAAIGLQFDSSYGPYAKKRTTRGGKDSTVYEVGWYGKKCRPLLEMLWPLVIVKRAQIELALEYLDTLVGSGYRFTPEVAAKRESLRLAMRELNHAGPNKPVTDSQVDETKEVTR